MLRSGKLVVSQNQTRVALDRVSPNRNSFIPSTKLPECFAFLLARKNQIVPFRQRLIQSSSRFLIAAESIQDRATFVEAQSLALIFLMSCGRAKHLYRLLSVAEQ